MMHAGRNFLRCVEGRTNSNLNIVVINDSGGHLLAHYNVKLHHLPACMYACRQDNVQSSRRTMDTDRTFVKCICRASSGGVKQASHLLKYDSTLGTFDADIK